MPLSVSPQAAEKLTSLLTISNYPDLSPETLLAAFQAEGIRSLEDLAHRMVRELESGNGQAQRIPYESLFTQPTPQAILDQIVHPVPEVPFVVDGIVYDPKDIARFNHRELGFIPQDGGESLLILADKSIWGPFMRSAMLTRAIAGAAEDYQYGGYSWTAPERPVGPGSSGAGGGSSSSSGVTPKSVQEPVVVVGPPKVQEVPYKIYYCTDSGLGGYWLKVDSGESRMDLTQVTTWLFGGNLNDEFSSYTASRGLSMAFEHIHFQGSYLWTGRSLSPTMELSSFGWNDRISSVINSG